MRTAYMNDPNKHITLPQQRQRQRERERESERDRDREGIHLKRSRMPPPGLFARKDLLSKQKGLGFRVWLPDVYLGVRRSVLC